MCFILVLFVPTFHCDPVRLFIYFPDRVTCPIFIWVPLTLADYKAILNLIGKGSIQMRAADRSSHTTEKTGGRVFFNSFVSSQRIVISCNLGRLYPSFLPALVFSATISSFPTESMYVLVCTPILSSDFMELLLGLSDPYHS